MSHSDAGDGGVWRHDCSEEVQEPPCGPDEDLRRFEEAKKEQGLGFASPISGALVLSNTLLGGSGMLGIPYALSVAGWGLGLVLIVVFGVFSAFGSHLLYSSARRIGTAPCSFYSVATAVVPNWTWLIDGTVMVKCLGVGVSYLIIVGDLAPPALRHLGLTGTQRWHAISVAFCIGGALSYARNLSVLRYTAAFAILIVAWTALLIVLFYVRPGDLFEPCTNFSKSAVAAAIAAAPMRLQELLPAEGALQLLADGSEALPCFGAEFKPLAVRSLLKIGKVLPVFIFGFTCQQNVFTVCNEVKEASKRRVDGMIISSYLLAGVCFMATALLGYATYGDKVEPDILKSYPHIGVVQTTRLLFAVLATFSFPLQMHPCRASALALWKILRGEPGATVGSERETFTEGRAGACTPERRRFLVTTTVLLAIAFITALSVQSLGLMLGVVGATGSTMVCYILPGLCYVMAYPAQSFTRVMAYCQLGLGCVIMPVCLLMVFL